MPELIEGKMIKGTAKAILMEINGEQIWIAKGQIECMPGFKAIFAISDWLACQKGLIPQIEFDKRRSQYGNQDKDEPSQETSPNQGNIPF